MDQTLRQPGDVAAAKCSLPSGWVDRDGACALFGVSEGTWVVWERVGRVPKGSWGRSRTNKPCRIYSIDELQRLRDRIRRERVCAVYAEGVTYTLPEGYVRQREAARMFGVDYSTFHRWELEGRITCGTRSMGGGVKVYPVEELEKLVAECGKYSPPYPDPDRPGVWRVPLAGRDIIRREALIDEADLPIVEGKRCHWSGRGADEKGQVILWDGRDTIRLRQLIMGVRGTAWRVGHRNGDPLDCRRENLMVRTKRQQGQGEKKRQSYGGKPCSSRFKGVCFDKQTGKWRAAIVVDGKTKRLGRHHDEIDAAMAYDDAASELFGEHARLNFPDGVDKWLEHHANANETNEPAMQQAA